MDVQSDFEREMKGRMEQLESALSALSSRVDRIVASESSFEIRRDAAPSSAWSPGAPSIDPSQAQAKPRAARPRFAPAAPGRTADWWLARAGAALTLVSLILLYQYAVSHGWITPFVRVLTGAGIGAALMHYGRKMEPAAEHAAFPVALREILMGSALAAWYITAFVATASYHLISFPAGRFVYLGLGIVGGLIALNERRALLAIIAIGGGCAAPSLLSMPTDSPAGSVPFLLTLGALSLYLYLMRGWQSVLWISFVMMFPNLERLVSLALYRVPRGAVSAAPLAVFDMTRIALTIAVLLASYAYYRAPTFRRRLMAIGSDRFTEPVRATFATTWLTETGRFFKTFSPAAGALDSLSLWVMTIVAPLAGMSVVSSAWHLNNSVWGVIAVVLAALSLRVALAEPGAGDEITHVHTVAATIWSLLGFALIGDAIGHTLGQDVSAIVLAITAIYAVALLRLLSGPRFVAAIATARLIAALAVLFVLYLELGSFTGNPESALRHVSMLLSAAEIVAVGAGLFAWRQMSGTTTVGPASVALAAGTYVAFLLVDARVLGDVWTPLVTASYAIIGTLMLIASRSADNQVMRKVGGITLAIVVARLMFVDLIGVDTIWRVLLFLGCGALFLFASHQLQSTEAGVQPRET